MEHTEKTSSFEEIKNEIQELKEELKRIHYAGTVGLRQEYERARPRLDALKSLLKASKSFSMDEQQDFQNQINARTRKFFKTEFVNSRDKEFFDKEFQVKDCLDKINLANTDILTFTHLYSGLLKTIYESMRVKSKTMQSDFYPEIKETISDAVKTNNIQHPYIKISMKFSGYGSIEYDLIDLNDGTIVATLKCYSLGEALQHVFELYSVIMDDERLIFLPFLNKDVLDEDTYKAIYELVRNVYLLLIKNNLKVDVTHTLLER